MKTIGSLLIAFAFTDFVLSWMGTDVWLDWFGIQVPEVIYRWTPLIVSVIGSVFIGLGSDSGENAGAAAANSEGDNDVSNKPEGSNSDVANKPEGESSVQ